MIIVALFSKLREQEIEMDKLNEQESIEKKVKNMLKQVTLVHRFDEASACDHV